MVTFHVETLLLDLQTTAFGQDKNSNLLITT